MNAIIKLKHIKGFFLSAVISCISYSGQAQILGGLLSKDFREISVSERAVFSGEVQLNQGLWLNGIARFSSDLRAAGNLEVGENVQIDGALQVSGMAFDSRFEVSTLIGSNEAGTLLKVGEEQLQQLLNPVAFPPIGPCLGPQTGATISRWNYDINKIVVDDCSRENVKVGIGTLDPLEKLHVTGGVQATRLHLRRNTPLNSSVSAELSGQILVGGHPNGAQFQERNIVFGYDNGSKRNFIESQSDIDDTLYLNPSTTAAVQVGTTSSPSNLKVEGINKISNAIIVGDNSASPIERLEVRNGNVVIRGATNFASYDPNQPQNSSDAFLYVGDTSHGIRAKRGVGLSLNTFANQNGLVLSEINGGVGIGIGDRLPTARLEVNVEAGKTGFLVSQGGDEKFRIASNGLTYARGMVVTLDDFPDYVFEDNYKRMEMEEIEKYINKHKRLPKMPSAKDVAENGANVAEIMQLLVEKVEELTLEMIELKKENVELSKLIVKQ